jgi:hemin uptake protein HemP
MNQPSDERHEEFQVPEGAPDESRLILRSEDLLQGRKEVWIEHGTEMYRLRVTAAGKLYLTK